MYNKMARLEEEYTRNQLEILILEPSDSVLDIGCGPGRRRFRLRGKHSGHALDVAPQMLAVCEQNVQEAGVSNLETRLLNWDDAIIGDNIEKHDVIIASRSVAMADLIKLNSAARKYVFVLSLLKVPASNKPVTVCLLVLLIP